MGSSTVSQHPESNVQQGQVWIDHGNNHKEAATAWLAAMNAKVQTLGPVYDAYKTQWNETYAAAHKAHHDYSKYCINYGQTCVGTGQAFDNAEHDNATLASSINTEGAAGIPTPDGELT